MKTPHLEFSGLPDNAHRCTSEINGDWVVFRCPHCPDYERRISLKTNTLIIKGKNEFTHYGSGGSLISGAAIITPN